MIVAYACIRTSIMYKCSEFVFCARNARNVKSQQIGYILLIFNLVMLTGKTGCKPIVSM